MTKAGSVQEQIRTLPESHLDRLFALVALCRHCLDIDDHRMLSIDHVVEAVASWTRLLAFAVHADFEQGQVGTPAGKRLAPNGGRLLQPPPLLRRPGRRRALHRYRQPAMIDFQLDGSIGC